MGKTIIITEKPSVAQEYNKALQVKRNGTTNGYIEGFSSVLNKDLLITWAIGHLVSICSPEEHNSEWGGTWNKSQLPMIPQTFKYETNKSVAKQFRVVKSLFTRKDIECIYYAGDSGREGVYIQALIRNQIFKSSPKFEERVVWLDSFTEESILSGIRNAKPYSYYLPMIESGYMRAISDWLIGMNFSRGFSLTSGTTIHVGRVMTPTLAMVVKRQAEIENFRKTDYYGIKVNDSNNWKWKAIKGSNYFESPLLYNETGFLKKEDAMQLLIFCNNSRQLTVYNVSEKQKTEYAPYLFNLADLQEKCSKMFKISPSETLAIAQSLYEKKLTTYPRTGSRYLTTAVQKDLLKLNYQVPNRYVDDKKVEDHYAIIPTFSKELPELSELEKLVYNLILKRFTDILLPPHIYNSISVTYIHQNGEFFIENYKSIIQQGFKENENSSEGKTDEIIMNKPVPQKGEIVTVSEFKLTEMATRPPEAYTTGTLVTAMEKAGNLIEDEDLRNEIKSSGIGTAATRASIIDKLIKQKYISVDKKQKVFPTEFGKEIIPLIARFDEMLISPVKTADMETRLSSIADKSVSAKDYRNDIDNYVVSTTMNILNNNQTQLSDGLKKSAVKTKPNYSTSRTRSSETKQSDNSKEKGGSSKPLLPQNMPQYNDNKTLYNSTGMPTSQSAKGWGANAINNSNQQNNSSSISSNQGKGWGSTSTPSQQSSKTTASKGWGSKNISEKQANTPVANVGKGWSSVSATPQSVKTSNVGKGWGSTTASTHQTTASSPSKGWGNVASAQPPIQQSAANSFSGISNQSADVIQHICPCCSNVITSDSERWYCNCGFSLKKEVCGTRLTENDISDICDHAYTDVKLFNSSKDGTQFKAYIVLDKNSKRFSFTQVDDWN